MKRHLMMKCPLYNAILFMNEAEKSYVLLGSLVIYSAAFPVTDIICSIFFEKFKLYNHDRRYYIISNILKSIMLIFVAHIFIFVLLTGILNPFTTSGFKELHIFMVNLSSLYCSTDIVSLILNYRAQKWSTRIHHIAVAIACWSIYTADFSGEGIYKGMMMYGAYSSLAAPVNTYLGARFILTKQATKILKKISYYSYILSCFVNWSWQIYYLFYLSYLSSLTGDYFILVKMVFMASMIFVWMKDDIVLIAHLKK